MKIVLLGSCVTRDIFGPQFENGWNDLHISMSFNRSSLISLASEPFNLDVSSNPLLNPFERRALSDDLNKTFFKYLSRLVTDGHYIIIDFIEERFGLYLHDNKYATISNEFVKSEIQKTLGGATIVRFSERLKQSWNEACLFLIHKLQEKFSTDHIILHKAFWMSGYKDGNLVIPFPDQDRIVRNNDLLNDCYRFFEENYPGIRILDLNGEGFYADKNHLWGLGEMHYEKDYYQRAMQYILDLNCR